MQELVLVLGALCEKTTEDTTAAFKKRKNPQITETPKATSDFIQREHLKHKYSITGVAITLKPSE